MEETEIIKKIQRIFIYTGWPGKPILELRCGGSEKANLANMGRIIPRERKQ